jgi:hypothetical protein
MPVTRVVCPRCRAAFQPSRPFPPGTTVNCPRCGGSFPAPAEERSAPIPVAVGVKPPPAAPGLRAVPTPGQSKVSLKRLAPVAGGIVLFLGLGLGLAVYCFSLNRGGAAAAGAPETKPADAPPAPVPEQPLITLPAEEQIKVDLAIVRGVRYLKTTQHASGTWDDNHAIGCAALPALVLLECGVPATDPTVRKAAEYVRAHCPLLTATYELALAVLFFDLLADSQDRHWIQTLAVRLVAGQNTSGGWTYDCPVLNLEEEKQLMTTLQDIGTQSFVEWKKLNPGAAAGLLPNVKHRAVFLDPDHLHNEFANWAGDNSNSQFAILALWAARRYDIRLERTVALLVKRYRTTQNQDGGWNYDRPREYSHPPWPTMTCAGLLGLAVGHGLVKEGQTAEAGLDADPAIAKGFLRASLMIGEPRRGGADRAKVLLGDLYFLWSVERVAVIYNRKTIADKDWYGWGEEMLLDNQDPTKGHWQNGGYYGNTPVLDTCFALLFLKQANLAKDLTTKLQLLSGSNKQ